MNFASSHIFAEYAVFDALRVVEIVLGFLLAGMLARVAFGQWQRSVPRWRIYFIVGAFSFTMAAILNGFQLMGEPPSARLFFNTVGLIFTMLATRGLVKLSFRQRQKDLDV